MNQSRLLKALGIIGLAVLYIAGNIYQSYEEKLSGVTSFSDQAAGTSIFAELAEKLHPKALAQRKTALLDAAGLQQTDFLIILSPSSPVSEHESKIIADYVRGGGRLLISFHNEETHFAVMHLLKALEAENKTKKRENFQNSVTVEASPSSDSELFEKDKTYSFYSAAAFDVADCNENEFSCFVFSKSFGAGQFTAVSGLPPIANALIGSRDNGSVAFSILSAAKRISLDEYHHFFSEKSVGDLLLLPSFGLPIFGMILIAVLFFLFGQTEFHQLAHRSPGSKGLVRGYHEMNESILTGLLRDEPTLRAAVEEQTQQLIHLFPKEKDRILKSAAFAPERGPEPGTKAHTLQRATVLLRLHQQLSAEKGGQKG